jgi:hypothetical protein
MSDDFALFPTASPHNAEMNKRIWACRGTRPRSALGRGGGSSVDLYQTIASRPSGTRDSMPVGAAIPIASFGPLADVIGVLGLAAAFSWIAWRFGPTLLRIAGSCSWWVAWACGSQGGYGYGITFIVLGTLAWVAGTAWYARRRGRWPSAISERLLTRALGRRSPLARGDRASDPTAVPLRRL